MPQLPNERLNRDVTSLVGRRIHAARTAQGYSLRALAEQVGVRHSTIHEYEQGRVLPSGAVLILLEKVLGTRLFPRHDEVL